MYDLEKDLPDELISSNSWGDQPGGGMSSKPPAQGPGPGNQSQINGDDSAVLQRQMQINHHLMQQVHIFQIIFIGNMIGNSSEMLFIISTSSQILYCNY